MSGRLPRRLYLVLPGIVLLAAAGYRRALDVHRRAFTPRWIIPYSNGRHGQAWFFLFVVMLVQADRQRRAAVT